MNETSSTGNASVASGENSAVDWQLAQINIARLVAAQGDPRVQPFFDALDRVNAIADMSPGFVWRLQTEAGNATSIQSTPDANLIVNVSVWTDFGSLSNFVYRSAHSEIMAQRRDFIEPFEGAFLALWWMPAGYRPSVDEGLARLWMLDRYGSSPLAFPFRPPLPPPPSKSDRRDA